MQSRSRGRRQTGEVAQGDDGSSQARPEAAGGISLAELRWKRSSWFRGFSAPLRSTISTAQNHLFTTLAAV
jgi:hypothetical protein